MWQWHFGEGIVRTPSDFGLRSDAPSHPDLLDWLARRFMDEGWSIKQLHRLIMTSAVYQQSATNDPAYGKIDPNNALLYKWNLRRLDFESMRDTLLVLGDNLDPRRRADVRPASRDAAPHGVWIRGSGRLAGHVSGVRLCQPGHEYCRARGNYRAPAGVVPDE